MTDLDEDFNGAGYEIIDIDGVPEISVELDDIDPTDDDIEKSVLDFYEDESMIDLGGGMIVPLSELIEDDEVNDLYDDLDGWNSDLLFDEVEL